MQQANTFPKSERLCGKIRIAKLFSEGDSFVVYPFRIVYQTTNEKTTVAVRVLTSASKRKLKKAVDRNRIKRQIREAYRLNKHNLYTYCDEKGLNLILAISYISDKKGDFQTMNQKISVALEKILKSLAQ